MKGRPVRERLGFAAAGLREAYAREKSFRTHVRLGAGGAVALAVLRAPPAWWAIIGTLAVLVLAFEMLNSALEGLLDLLHPGLHPEIKVIKDMASGAVMLMGIGAVIAAVCLLVDVGPRALQRWGLA